MKLSELKTGEKGVIVKVLGHGGFRKRIIEMGFIKGKEVEVLLNAPLQDPVKYKLMGYEVSLRHQEAESIEVVNSEELRVKNMLPPRLLQTRRLAILHSSLLTLHSIRMTTCSTLPGRNAEPSTWRSWAILTAERPRFSTTPAALTDTWATTAVSPSMLPRHTPPSSATSSTSPTCPAPTL